MSAASNRRKSPPWEFVAHLVSLTLFGIAMFLIFDGWPL